ncbi:MAG: methyl-accepting chemotaxis protein [Pseudomonadota bacterium]
MKKNHPVTQQEHRYPDDANILSTTNLKGIITYVNGDFIEVSGFTNDELLGNNHNMVRHPDMPPEAFQDLWDHLKSGRSWMGIVKNRCKNGDHYWVDAYVTPIRDAAGNVLEYQSVRTRPERHHVERAESLYAAVNAGRLPWRLRWGRFLGLRVRLLSGFLIALLPLLLALFAPPLAGTIAQLGAVILSLILALGVVWFTMRPVCAAVAETRDIADDPLMQLVYTGRVDELGQLRLAIKMLQQESEAIAGRIADTALGLRGDTSGLSEDVTRSRHNIEEQERQAEQVASAVQQMVASIQEVVQTTRQASEAASAATGTADEGRTVVNGAITTIDTLAADVERAASALERLAEQAGDVGSILDVIRDIADRTNLLALNAAIEAARAGEAGRGFAVVADEVRNLAQQTQESTGRIESIVDGLKGGTTEAVETMNQGREQARHGVEQAREATAALESIADAIGGISEMNGRIATAAEEQGSVSEEISRSITSISDAAHETSDSIGHVNEAADAIAGRMDGLQRLAEQFRTQWSGGEARDDRPVATEGAAESD